MANSKDKNTENSSPSVQKEEGRYAAFDLGPVGELMGRQKIYEAQQKAHKGKNAEDKFLQTVFGKPGQAETSPGQIKIDLMVTGSGDGIHCAQAEACVSLGDPNVPMRIGTETIIKVKHFRGHLPKDMARVAKECELGIQSAEERIKALIAFTLSESVAREIEREADPHRWDPRTHKVFGPSIADDMRFDGRDNNVFNVAVLIHRRLIGRKGLTVSRYDSPSAPRGVRPLKTPWLQYQASTAIWEIIERKLLEMSSATANRLAA